MSTLRLNLLAFSVRSVHPVSLRDALVAGKVAVKQSSAPPAFGDGVASLKATLVMFSPTRS